MKTTKIFIAAVFVAVLGISANAQDKKVEFGFLGGYGFTMPKISGVTAKDDLSGFHVGPMLKYNINDQIGLQTGVYFNYFSGVNLTSSAALKKNTGVWNQSRTNLIAFDVPLRVVYSTPLAEDFRFFVFAGPNFNYSLRKITNTESYVDKKLSSKINGTNIYESKEYKPFDVQIGAGMGVQWMGVSIRAGYDWGILNRTTKDNTTFRQNDIKVSLGYTF